MKKVLRFAAIPLALMMSVGVSSSAATAKDSKTKHSAAHRAAIRKCGEEYRAAIKEAKKQKGSARKDAEAAARQARKQCVAAAPM